MIVVVHEALLLQFAIQKECFSTPIAFDPRCTGLRAKTIDSPRLGWRHPFEAGRGSALGLRLACACILKTADQ